MSYFRSLLFFLPTAVLTLAAHFLLAQHPGIAKPILSSNQSGATQSEKGRPYLRNYSHKEYGAFIQNWAVLQDKLGVMYIGNGHGVLTYNGVSWQLIETPDRSVIRSLAMDKTGRIYVGASGDIGFIATDAKGKPNYHSLLPHLKSEDRTFDDVWKTYATPEGVYFQSNKRLFRWANNRFRQWKPDSAFHSSFWLNNQLYVQDKRQGLLEMRNETLQPVPQGKKFVGMKVQAMLPLANKLILIGTRQDGLFLYNGTSISPFSSATNQFFIDNQLYQGMVLPDSTLAFATLRGGLVLMDQSGQLIQVINQSKGLSGNSVYNLGLDNQGGCWLALDKGISRLELNAPFTLFGQPSGLEGAVSDMVRHHGQLYVSTSLGVYVLENPLPEELLSGKPAHFRQLSEPSDYCWGFLSDGERLLIASEKGICQLQNGKTTWLNNYRANILHRSQQDPNRIFVSLEDGLASLRWDGHHWKDEGKFEGIHENIHSINETKKGELWLSTFWQGLIRVSFPADSVSGQGQRNHSPVVEKLGEKQGLPKGYVRVNIVEGKAIIRMGNSGENLFLFDEASHRFDTLSSEDFARRFGLTGEVAFPSLDQLPSGEIWLKAKGERDKDWQRVLATPKPDGGYILRTYRMDRITEDIKRVIYPEANGIVWYGGPDGVIRHDLNQEKNQNPGFQALIDRIIINQDSVVYPMANANPFDFSNNSLRFEFGAPSYDNEKANEFQFLLEGYDDDWSGWTKEPFKEYTRIPDGEYTFRMRARNIYGQIGKEAVYAFGILPPWYKTWPMYGLYALLIFGLMYTVVRWRSAQLRREKRALEKIVVERTHEIAEKNQQLEQQAGQLKEMDKMKSNFFANISHEFRTPLTLILGTLTDKLGWFRQKPEVAETPIRHTEVKVMHRNAQRLLQLVNQLLDLSKIESGKLELHLRNGDLKQLLEVVTASFSSLAEFRRIQFDTILPNAPIRCRFDADQVEKIFYNLLSNAFKFTPDGGHIILKAERVVSETGKAQPSIRITVQDSGPGIPAKQLDKVFERFYQGAQQYQSDQQGTGIGLALTKELVQLHQGAIRVESELGQGARFVVQLPFLEPDVPSVMLPETLELPSETKEPVNQEAAAIQSQTILPKQGASSSVLPDNESLPILLIVEDNEDLRAYIRGHLETHYRVVESENGVQGWETALATLPDLIISDWMMPEMDGIALCQRIKTDERTSHIPFILLTALATNEGKLTGLETGADEYLTKPFDARELHLRVRNLIETRRKLRERFGRELRIQPSEITVTSADEKFLQRVMKIAEENLGDSEFSAEQFGREVGLSRMQLHRKLTALTGQSSSDFIRMMRLKRAAQLFEAQTGTVSEIAYEVGFNNLSYFAKCFREQFGELPNEYLSRQTIQPE